VQEKLGGGNDHRGNGVSGKASFCEQKEAKKLYYAGLWASALTQPMAQHKKVFAPLFSKSGRFLNAAAGRFGAG
jgi:hypothetical protein